MELIAARSCDLRKTNAEEDLHSRTIRIKEPMSEGIIRTKHRSIGSQVPERVRIWFAKNDWTTVLDTPANKISNTSERGGVEIS